MDNLKVTLEIIKANADKVDMLEPTENGDKEKIEYIKEIIPMIDGLLFTMDIKPSALRDGTLEELTPNLRVHYLMYDCQRLILKMTEL